MKAGCSKPSKQATPGALPKAMVSAFGWPPPPLLCAQIFPGAPSVSHHLVVVLRAWRVAVSWARAKHRFAGLCAEPGHPRTWGLPDSMMGEGVSAVLTWPPRLADGQPREEATWQGCVVVKCSSLGFISKMLLHWQEILPAPSKGGCQKHQWPWENSGGAGAVGLLEPSLGILIPSRRPTFLPDHPPFGWGVLFSVMTHLARGHHLPPSFFPTPKPSPSLKQNLSRHSS